MGREASILRLEDKMSRNHDVAQQLCLSLEWTEFAQRTGPQEINSFLFNRLKHSAVEGKAILYHIPEYSGKLFLPY